MNPSTSGRLIGHRGGAWRGTVTEHGSVLPADGSAELDWFIAADDRWYTPRTEASTRQKWYAGYPVAETRVKIPGGDIVQRVYVVADLGGMTVMEFENDSPMPVVVAVTRRDVFTTREPAVNPPVGIDLPSDSIVIPVGHKSSSRIALAHKNPASGRLPEDTPNHQAVVRGWEKACDTASRINVPDHTIVAGVSRVRSDLLLGVGADDAAIELARLGETHHDSILDVVESVQRRLKAEKRVKVLQWDTPHLMTSAARACVLLGDEVAAGDIGATWLRFADRDVQELPIEVPTGLASIAWAESLLAQGSASGGVCRILPHGIPEPWWGASFEAHGLTGDPFRTVGYAVRWHGPRPAILWEVSGAPGLVLTNGEWASTDATGETLLEAPVSDHVHDHGHDHDHDHDHAH
jgi:hypothetical protein